MIYVLEVKDKFADWHPCRTLDMTAIAFPELKYAEKVLKEHRAHVRSGKLGASIMKRANTRYRLVKYDALSGDDQFNLFTEGNGRMVFVFGSNEAGIHGAGAARAAVVKHGARMGCSFGMQGTSFAIPTKGTVIVRGNRVVGDSLRIEKVAAYVNQFIAYAKENHHLKFQVTQIGCGLAGFTAEQIAPLFEDAPENCFFDDAWKPFLPGKNFWGTF
jgi:hypothetical protein